MHPLEVTKHINKIIYDDPVVKSFIDDRIFQLIQKNGIQEQSKPYIISSRGSVSSTATKDKRTDNTVSYTVDIYSILYTEQVNIAIQVDNAISGTHNVNGEYFYCIVDEFIESFHDDRFLQSITFTVRLN